MLRDAKDEFGIDLQNSIMVGDKERDIEAAMKAGVKNTYFFDEYHKTTDSKATKIVHRLDEIYR